jgi:hypothetical protein
LDLPVRQPAQFSNKFAARREFLDRSWSASKNLRTIAPNDKGAAEQTIAVARAALAASNVVYILGYGFDENNSHRIGLDLLLKSRSAPYRSIMFTNFGDVNQVNKRASRLWFSTPDVFLRSSIWGGNPRTDHYIEKSVRTVYQALSYDFDDLEGQLLPDTTI